MSSLRLKSFAALFGALFSLVMLQLAEAQASAIPNCAVGCFNQSLSASGCSTDDSNCLCSSNSFISSILQCSGLVCSTEEQAATTLALGNMCSIDTTSSSGLGTSTGTFSGTKSGSSASQSSSTGVITLTTTFPGGSTATITATISATPSPPISFTTSVTVINPSSRPSGTSTVSVTSTSVTTSSTVPPKSSTTSSTTIPVTTSFSTVTSSGNGVSTAPAATSSSSGDARAIRVDGGVLGVGLSLVGAMAVLRAL